MADEEYSFEVVEDDAFSLDGLGRYPSPAPAQQVMEEDKLPEYMARDNSTEGKRKQIEKEPKELKGAVLKNVRGEWKDRYIHVRPKVRALFYYEKLAKAKKNSKPLGVYPLLGATVSQLLCNTDDDSFTFSLSLRTGQIIWFKLLDQQEGRVWRSALRDAAQQPCTAPLEGTYKGECTLKQTLMNAKRTIVLDYSSGYFCTYKKTDELSPMEQHPLKESIIIPQKSFDASFDVIIQSGKDYKKEYSFKTPEEWAKWCVELEAVVNREKHSRLNSR